MAHEKFKVGPEDKLRKSHPTPQLMQKTFKEQDTRFQNQGEVGILCEKIEKVCTKFGCDHSSYYKDTIRTHIPVVVLIPPNKILNIQFTTASPWRP